MSNSRRFCNLFNRKGGGFLIMYFNYYITMLMKDFQNSMVPSKIQNVIKMAKIFLCFNWMIFSGMK